MLDETFLQALREYVLTHRAASTTSARGSAMPKPSHWPKHAGIGPVVCRDATLGERECVDANRMSPFSTELLATIDERGLADVDVCRRAGLDGRLLSELRGTGYRPSKPTALALCLALDLGPADTEGLLAKAGYALGQSDVSDLVIRYCIEHGVNGLANVDEALASMGQEPLSAGPRD
jgi:hypothetical protein